jgi:DnaJ family protein B protein 4
VPVEDVLTVNVKPGWKKGTKITFPEKGNQQPCQIPADLVFLIDEKPHHTFVRDGDDLITIQKINLSDALVGLTVTLTAPDYRILNIPCYVVIRPDFEKTIKKEGMPMYREPGKKGNLILRFEIKFPIRNLTNDQKEAVKKCLPESVY